MLAVDLPSLIYVHHGGHGARHWALSVLPAGHVTGPSGGHCPLPGRPRSPERPGIFLPTGILPPHPPPPRRASQDSHDYPSRGPRLSSALSWAGSCVCPSAGAWPASLPRLPARQAALSTGPPSVSQTGGIRGRGEDRAAPWPPRTVKERALNLGPHRELP